MGPFHEPATQGHDVYCCCVKVVWRDVGTICGASWPQPAVTGTVWQWQSLLASCRSDAAVRRELARPAE